VSWPEWAAPLKTQGEVIKSIVGGGKTEYIGFLLSNGTFQLSLAPPWLCSEEERRAGVRGERFMGK